MSEFLQFPPQQLPDSKKTKAWRKQVVDWGANRATISSSLVRKSVIHKKINYDLVDGIIHLRDFVNIINPEHVRAKYIPTDIQHYPILNSKLNVLRGEEAKRLFDYRVVVTNPNAISDIEENKRAAIVEAIQSEVENTAQSDEEFQANIAKYDDFFTYQWQDMRELRANELLKHYVKEYNMALMFNNGFMDALTVAEEIYQCDIVGGEPIVERLNPNKVRIYKSGYSNKIEDADIIVIEDYWSPGKIIDYYHEVLTAKDMEYINNLPDTIDQGTTDSFGNIDERGEFIRVDDGDAGDAVFKDGFFWSPTGSYTGDTDSLLPYDIEGNIRVVRMFWKSRRRIKKVKYYDENGDEQHDFFPMSYKSDFFRGEEEQIFYVNEAWEGTKIGDNIYVNMRPKIIQYNRLSNPSRCHFGIIGSIYNTNDSKPFSLVDMMKPFSYLYDAIHDRLNKLIAKNWGAILQLDLAKVPKGWDINKWLYFAKTNSIAVLDSFKEGNIGAAQGKLAGALNNASSGVINADLGNSIQQHINLLEYIKQEMSDVVGISKQREGQIAAKETVGGVERATLQSSYITEWLFTVHNDVKRRVLECFLETAKIALRGRNKKFQYILSDGSKKIMDIEGDEFAECDYGIIVDDSNGTQELNQKLEMLAQAALQNRTINFSTIMKLYNSASLSEKQRMIEKNEQELAQRQQEEQQQQMQIQQQQINAEMQSQKEERELKDSLNKRDNDTKLMVATIAAEATKAKYEDGVEEPEYSQEAKEKLMEQIREFDAQLQLSKDKLALEKEKMETSNAIKKEKIKQTANKESK